MKYYKFLSKYTLLFTLLLAIYFSNCSNPKVTSYTITVGAFTQDSNGQYVFTGNELMFDSNEECQTWSRNASADSHSISSHLHYNAAANLSYDNNKTNLSWTEYGPELDQQSIEATCINSIGGVSKTVNDSLYFQDKPNLFLKITNIIEN